MKALELTASILTLIAIWLLSEKLYIEGFLLSVFCCIIWVVWCYKGQHYYLLGLEFIMGILYLKSFIGVI